jgi:hypothetical protein
MDIREEGEREGEHHEGIKAITLEECDGEGNDGIIHPGKAPKSRRS